MLATKPDLVTTEPKRGRPKSTAAQKAARKQKYHELKAAAPGSRITMCKCQQVAVPIPGMEWYTHCPVCKKDVRKVDDHPHWLHSEATVTYTPPFVTGTQSTMF